MSTAFSNCAVTLTQSRSTVPLNAVRPTGRVTMIRVVYGAVVPSAAGAVPETKYSRSW